MVRSSRVVLEATVTQDNEPAIAAVRQARAMSQNAARRLFATGKVYVDGKPCLDWWQPLPVGSSLSVNTDRRNLRRMPELTASHIVFQDASVVVVNKPAGLVSVPPTTTGEPTTLELLTGLLAESKSGQIPVALHRLDRDTRGLMLFGLSGCDLSSLRDQFANHQVTRLYYAMVEGHPKATVLESTIDVTREQHRGKQHQQYARTEIEPVRRAGPCTLLKCRPHTGRYHQIRIQLADSGYPLVGDRQHHPGTAMVKSRWLGLQSFFVSFRRPDNKGRKEISLPLDPDFVRLMERLEAESTT
jgi:23S rRNA pseudouridine1911/1915/1917 synthase